MSFTIGNRALIRTAILTALVLATASAAGAQTDGSERISSGIDAAAERYSADVYWLADDARQGRGLGSQGLAKAGLWLEKQFKSIGLEPAGDDGGYRHVFGVPIADPENPHAQKGFVYAFNVMGRISGNGELDGVVLIGAHFDHLGLESHSQWRRR
jgi:acetylornithine deacetylase/succinyl-diaminopimelate desuccinylase-like protein